MRVSVDKAIAEDLKGCYEDAAGGRCSWPAWWVVEIIKRASASETHVLELESVWRSLVGDGTDTLTPSGLKSLIEDYQQELAQKRVIERALEFAVKDVRLTMLRNTDEDEIKQAWLDKAATQLEKERL